MSIESVLQFRKYIVEKIDYQINEDFDIDGEIELDFDIDYEIMIDEEEDLAVIKILCEVFPDNQANVPFNVTVELSGLFTYSNVEKEDLKDLLSINGVSILFPYIRTVISTITSVSGYPPVILPTINVHNYIKNRKIIDEETNK